MKRLVLIIALVCAVWPVVAQKARVDFDHAGDFSHYRTYRWVGPPDMDSFNQLMQERVTGMVEEALASKQLKRVQTGGDLLVGLRMNVQEQPVFTTFTDSTGFGWGAGWGSSMSTTTVSTIPAGHTYDRPGGFAQEPTGVSGGVNCGNQFETRSQH